MRKAAVGGIVVVGFVAGAGVAWAALGGILNVPDVLSGVAAGPGAVSCQSGSTVTFDVPTPTWDNVTGEYSVSTLDYSGITNTCVTLGTADLLVNVTLQGSNSSVANAQSLNMGSASGTLVLSSSVAYDDLIVGDINFLVRNE